MLSSFNDTIARMRVNDLNWTRSVSIWTDKKFFYFNLHQNPVEYENKNKLIESQLFLWDIGSTCSLNKFDIYECFCETKTLNLIKFRSNTVAVKQEKREFVGDTVYFATSGSSFDFLVKF